MQMQWRTLDEVGDGAGAAVLHDELQTKASGYASGYASGEERVRA